MGLISVLDPMIILGPISIAPKTTKPFLVGCLTAWRPLELFFFKSTLLSCINFLLVALLLVILTKTFKNAKNREVNKAKISKLIFSVYYKVVHLFLNSKLYSRSPVQIWEDAENGNIAEVIGNLETRSRTRSQVKNLSFK